MRNYAGHRLAPWLAHVMVSRQETARALLTPGEVMQLPADEQLVLVAGHPPIRARKLRYFEEPRLVARCLPEPKLGEAGYLDLPPVRAHDWADQERGRDARLVPDAAASDDEAGGLERQQQPELPDDRNTPDPEPQREPDAEDADQMPAQSLADLARGPGVAATTAAFDEAAPDGHSPTGIDL